MLLGNMYLDYMLTKFKNKTETKKETLNYIERFFFTTEI